MVMLASESCAEAKFVTERVGMPIVLNTDRIMKKKIREVYWHISGSIYCSLTGFGGGETRGYERPTSRSLHFTPGSRLFLLLPTF